MKPKTFYFAFPATFLFALTCIGVMIYKDFFAANGTSFMVNHWYSPMWRFWNPTEWKDYFDYRFFTHAIGHGNWAHLNGNLIFLLPVALQVEQHYKARILLPLMFFTALFTGIVQFFLVGTPLVGASGIVFLFIALSCFADNDAKRIPIDGSLVALMFVSFELYNMFFSDDKVSQLAHLIGAGVGIIYGAWLQKHPNSKAKAVKD